MNEQERADMLKQLNEATEIYHELIVRLKELHKLFEEKQL